MALKTWLSLVLAVTLALTACGGDASGPETAADTAPAAATAPTTPAAPAPTTTATQQARSQTSTQAVPPATTAAPPQTTPPEPVPDTQPAPQPEPAEPAREPVGVAIKELAVLSLVNRASPREYTQAGTVTGTYDGTMTLDATITNRGVVVEFVATLEGGTIAGRGITRPVISTSPLAGIEGTVGIVGGSGRFAGVRGRRLMINGRAKLDGSYARVRLAGTIFY